MISSRPFLPCDHDAHDEAVPITSMSTFIGNMDKRNPYILYMLCTLLQ